MTSRKDPAYFGTTYCSVDFDLLIRLINQTNLTASRTPWGVSVQHESFHTAIRVLAPPSSPNSTIESIVTVRSAMPEGLASIFDTQNGAGELNQLATLGALTKSADGYHVESRLTIFEGENASNIHLPLLMFTAIASAESILGGLRRALSTSAPSRNNKSKWTAKDLQAVEQMIENFSVCNANGLGLTAEFGLEPGADSAMMGHKTALLQLSADQPHPEVGGGLFCLLSMPQRIDNKGRLQALAAELNRLEMLPADQPPHFGAWCVGDSGTNVAYVSFLLNAMHEIPGIATNVAIWAMHRAEWANSQIQRILSPPVQPRAPQPTAPAKAASPQFAREVHPPTKSDQCSLLIKNTFGIGLSKEKLLDIERHLRSAVPAGWTKLAPDEQERILHAIKQKYPSVMYNEVARLVKALEKNEFFK